MSFCPSLQFSQKTGKPNHSLCPRLSSLLCRRSIRSQIVQFKDKTIHLLVSIICSILRPLLTVSRHATLVVSWWHGWLCVDRNQICHQVTYGNISGDTRKKSSGHFHSDRVNIIMPRNSKRPKSTSSSSSSPTKSAKTAP